VDADAGSPPEDYQRALSDLGAAALAALHGLEVAQRHLHPPRIAELRAALEPGLEPLERTLEAFRAIRPSELTRPLHAQLEKGSEHAAAALRVFLEAPEPQSAVLRILEAFREHCRALETLYPLHRVLPPLDRFFSEPFMHDELEALAPAKSAEKPLGILRAGAAGDPEARGGFHLYVPEYSDGSHPMPLVVALHGGFGHGRDFLWTWLREARSRGFLLLAPTSRGSTWSLADLSIDLRALRSMVGYVTENYPADRSRVLLTGLSDGGTFSLLAGLAEESPFTALAPMSCVLHPANLALGNLDRARDVPVFWVHGALDWMFPAAMARAARDKLSGAGARVVYREVADLSHTHAREQNDAVLRWFAPGLRHPPGAGKDPDPAESI
jgi:phospholipase/carboxylesterase